ncbi:uncharacterized protein LOC143240398 isoform X2 [Tachypleus tridentatus]|uniref:uncharacterized protein LOC143240398 isoform X2 n=1 Tax=Tachypleus tridentatus TaxID=6853 RepID=UPI003FD412FC
MCFICISVYDKKCLNKKENPFKMRTFRVWLTIALLYVTHVTGKDNCTCVTDRSLEGKLLKHPSNPSVYQILDGCRHGVPNPPTYNNLYKNWECIQSNILEKLLCKCESLSNGAELIKGSGDTVYLLSNGIKRPIADPETFNGFCFDWNKIKTYSDIVINNLPVGPIIKIK